jgi:hypothetical protein
VAPHRDLWSELDENHAMTVLMSPRHAYQAKHDHHFRGRHCGGRRPA